MFKLCAHQFRQVTQIVSKRQIGTTRTVLTAKQTDTLIDVTKALQGWHQRLRKAGIGDIDFNLKCLVAHVLKIKFKTLSEYNNLQFNVEQYKEFEKLCKARCARMPLQHILGEWDFMNIILKTAPTVCIPRPDTEEFVAKVIDVYRKVHEPIDMLEVGCGSGAMSLAILHNLPNFKSTGIELSKLATALSRENTKLLNLEKRFKIYNHTMSENNYLPKELDGRKFDLIISNPPYVKTEEFALLHPEVTLYEHLTALDGGPDGLRVARLVFNCACNHLKRGGKLWMELGADHPPLVKTIMNLQYEGRLRFISSYLDHYKRDRFVEIEKI